MKGCTVIYPRCMGVAVSADKSHCTCQRPDRPNRKNHEERILALEGHVQALARRLRKEAP